jgi:hypothetical protein
MLCVNWVGVLGFNIETGQVESCAILAEKSFRLNFIYTVHFCDKMVKKIKEFPSIFFLFSPDGKAKIQLQIVLHDGNSTTFHFVNPAGTKTIGKPKTSRHLRECISSSAADLRLRTAD